MLAINHAASALLFKKRFPDVSMPLILISVQLTEFLWIVFCYLGIEYITTSEQVRYIGDIHRVFMPFSHSLLSSFVLSGFAYIVIKIIFKNNRTAIVVSLAILSHIVLDILMNDIPVIFFSEFTIGTGLWITFPYIAFYIELTFGFLCWWYYRGTRKLLAVIIFFNMLCFTLFSPDIVGFEQHLANKPALIILVILSLIIITSFLIGFLSKKMISLEPEPAVSPKRSLIS